MLRYGFFRLGFRVVLCSCGIIVSLEIIDRMLLILEDHIFSSDLALIDSAVIIKTIFSFLLTSLLSGKVVCWRPFYAV